MKIKLLTLIIPALYLLCGGFASEAASPVTLPWSTTYNCPTWTQSDGLGEATVNCDSLKGWGTWKCDQQADGIIKEEEITSAANHAAGDGGKGQRQWNGDGVNKNSGGLSIEFTPAQPEFWVRWYMRYQAGFQWNPLSYDKIIYIDVNAKNTPPLYKNTDIIIEWYGANQSRIHVQSVAGGQSLHSASGVGSWPSTMGGAGSDGLWHSYEVHLKMDTTGSNGVAEMWIDGTQVIFYNTVNFGTYDGWTQILFGSNQLSPNNGGCRSVDFDDIAIRNTGYIGPLPGMTSKPGTTILSLP